jgi:hypothetical protein
MYLPEKKELQTRQSSGFIPLTAEIHTTMIWISTADRSIPMENLKYLKASRAI